MLRRTTACLFLAASVIAGAIPHARSLTNIAEASSRKQSPAIEQAASPGNSVQLSLRAESGAGNRRQLTLMRETTPMTSVSLPADLAAGSIDAGIRTAVWNDARTAVAVAFARPQATFVAAFIQRQTREYVGTDISEVETRTIGAIGPFRTYVRRTTVPLKWETWSEARPVLRVQTTVWDESGQRYRGTEALVFLPDGTPFWR